MRCENVTYVGIILNNGVHVENMMKWLTVSMNYTIARVKSVSFEFTVYVKIFVVDLILLFSWLASIDEKFSLSEVSPTKIFPTNFLFRLGTCHQPDSAVPDLHSNIPTSLLR